MRRFGDRSDGVKLRNVDPFFRLIPHIMTRRSDSQVFFDAEINVEETYRLMRELNATENTRISFLTVVIAAMVRTLSQRPKLNRFISGRQAYARNKIAISFTIKKDMTDEGEETALKIEFSPTDTLMDVSKRINDAILFNKQQANSNSADRAVTFFNKLPNFLLTWSVGFLKFLDRHRMMPKSIIKLSPFHASVFVTDVGSLRISPVYHHIYDFGTVSVFVSFGIKRKEFTIDQNAQVSKKKKIDFKVVIDERITDGYYFASSLRSFVKIIQNPECLLEKPESVIVDNEI